MKTNLNAIYKHPGTQELRRILGEADHRTLVLWALDTGKEVMEIFNNSYPDDPRPAAALAAAEAWSRGDIKMPAAKRAAKETHQAASDVLAMDQSKAAAAAAAAAHAMGQIIGIVHVGTHAPAYAAYAVQASVLLNEGNQKNTMDSNHVLEQSADHLLVRLLYWETAPKNDRPWASFL